MLGRERIHRLIARDGVAAAGAAWSLAAGRVVDRVAEVIRIETVRAFSAVTPIRAVGAAAAGGSLRAAAEVLRFT